MNTVTKQLFLALGLCFIAVGITQPGEHKRAESASELLHLPKVVESVESLGTVDPKDEGSVDIHDYPEEGLNDEAQLTERERKELKKNMPQHIQVILGTDRFPQEPFEGPKKVKPPFKKPSKQRKWAGCLSCLAK